METNATRMCVLLVGLPDVTVIGVAEWPMWLRIVIEAPGERPACCCGGVVHRHGVREVELVDLPVFGRPARLVWRKQRRRCTTCRRCWCDEHRDRRRPTRGDDSSGPVVNAAGRPQRSGGGRCGRRARLQLVTP